MLVEVGDGDAMAGVVIRDTCVSNLVPLQASLWVLIRDMSVPKPFIGYIVAGSSESVMGRDEGPRGVPNVVSKDAALGGT